jgi:hypothetical protein
MKIILVLLFFGITLSLISAQNVFQIEKKKFSQNTDKTVRGISFTNIARSSDKCVMISGGSQFGNNFFLDS